MLSKTVQVKRYARSKVFKHDTVPMLVTTWKLFGIPVFVSKVINP